MTQLPLAEIKDSPLLSARLDESPDSLTESLKEMGILTPLILTPDLLLISGFRRLAFARESGLAKVPVKIITFPSPDALFRFIVREQELSFALSPIEKLRLFALFSHCYATKELLSLLPIFSLSQDDLLVDMIDQVLDLPRPIQLFLHQRQAHLFKFGRVLFLDEETKEMLVWWVEKQGITLSLFEEIVTLLHKLSVQKNNSGKVFLKERGREPKSLRQALQEAAYPQTVRHKKRQEQAMEMLDPPSCLKLSLPLPAQSISFSGTFRRRQDVESLVEWIGKKKIVLSQLVGKLSKGEEE